VRSFCLLLNNNIFNNPERSTTNRTKLLNPMRSMKPSSNHSSIASLLSTRLTIYVLRSTPCSGRCLGLPWLLEKRFDELSRLHCASPQLVSLCAHSKQPNPQRSPSSKPCLPVCDICPSVPLSALACEFAQCIAIVQPRPRLVCQQKSGKAPESKLSIVLRAPELRERVTLSKGLPAQELVASDKLMSEAQFLNKFVTLKPKKQKAAAAQQNAALPAVQPAAAVQLQPAVQDVVQPAVGVPALVRPVGFDASAKPDADVDMAALDLLV
jgi:hypothetical protein